MSENELDRYKVLSHQMLRNLARTILPFLQNNVKLPTDKELARTVAIRSMAILGRGYLVAERSNSRNVELLFDLETANQRFDAISIEARRRDVIRPHEIVRIRTDCWHDSQRIAETAFGSPSARSIVQDARKLPSLADALIEAVATISRRAQNGALLEDPDLSRIAPQLEALLVGPARESMLDRLSHDHLEMIAMQVYEAVVRADRCARMDALRGQIADPWRDVVEARDVLRSCLYSAKCRPEVLSGIIVTDARDWLLRESPAGIEAFFRQHPNVLERIARSIRHLGIEDLALLRRALLTDGVLENAGLGRIISDALVTTLKRYHPAGMRLPDLLDEADPAMIAPSRYRRSFMRPGPAGPQAQAGASVPSLQPEKSGLGRRLVEALLME